MANITTPNEVATKLIKARQSGAAVSGVSLLPELRQLMGTQPTVVGRPLNVGQTVENFRSDGGNTAGIGVPIGPQQNFDAVLFRIQPKSAKPSIIRVRILENNNTILPRIGSVVDRNAGSHR